MDEERREIEGERPQVVHPAADPQTIAAVGSCGTAIAAGTADTARATGTAEGLVVNNGAACNRESGGTAEEDRVVEAACLGVAKKLFPN